MTTEAKKGPITGLPEKDVRPSRQEITASAREIAKRYGKVPQYIVVCPEHGAAGPYNSEEDAAADADYLNATAETSCTYRVLPLFSNEV